jgi:hypothetical protein
MWPSASAAIIISVNEKLMAEMYSKAVMLKMKANQCGLGGAGVTGSYGLCQSAGLRKRNEESRNQPAYHRENENANEIIQLAIMAKANQSREK